MSLDRIWQLDAVGPTSNSNYQGANIQELCAPSGLNNALRALGSMVTREIAYQASAISASVSTNIVTSSTGLYVPIVGAGAINSFGVVPNEQPSAAVLRILEFSSSASLSHGGSIFLPGGESIRTQPGDILGLLHEGSGDQWRGLFYSRASGQTLADSMSVTTITNRSMSTSAISTVTLNAASASVTTIGITALNSVASISASVGSFTLLKVGGHGTLAQVVYDSEAAYTTLGTILPLDNSIPQNTEGDEILAVTITPTNANSLLEIKFTGSFGSSSARCSAALFVDSTAAALNANGATISNSGQMNAIALNHVLTAGSTTARTYKIRAGSDVAADCFLNGDSVSRQYGGIAAAFLIVTEILPQ